MKKLLLGSLLVSSAVLAAGPEAAITSSAAVSSNEVGVGKYFYIAKNYQELAAVPGFTMSAPAGLVPGKGVVFAGIGGLHTKGKKGNDTDGSMALGFGYGNPYETLGGAISLSLGSINPDDGGEFNRGSLNISLGHNFSNLGVGLAVGVNTIDMWHAKGSDKMDESYYVAMTKLLPNGIVPVAVTAGVGNNDFAKITQTGDKKDHMHPFVSLAAYVLPQVSLIADYTSDIVTLGVGLVPSPKLPITITMGAYNVNRETIDIGNDKTSFIASLSAAYSF
ncbi:Uncharacterised protein [Fusobacterium necrogenes]|uniref:Uncharacterized protein n=1 Tax=Fusobacterium necrogenes TaxID=858 RepID=A0A377GZ61_9FUSO|nr:hypothetical protein [Fusobacterium necrogenes]STO32287.1 Uncharacterised protein [Fusobacterium necrogenes]